MTTNTNPEHVPHADPQDAVRDSIGVPGAADEAMVEIGGERMTPAQFRAARAGLAAGVASETEHAQLREVFAPRTLPALQKRAYENSRVHGFHETDEWLEQAIADLHDVVDRKVVELRIDPEAALTWLLRMKELRDAYRGNRLMLIAGEVTEAHEELRSGHAVDEVYFPEQVKLELNDEGLYDEVNVASKKPEGVPAELADIGIRLLDTCESWGVDLEREMIRKMDFNETRPAKHGRRF